MIVHKITRDPIIRNVPHRVITFNLTSHVILGMNNVKFSINCPISPPEGRFVIYFYEPGREAPFGKIYYQVTTTHKCLYVNDVLRDRLMVGP